MTPGSLSEANEFIIARIAETDGSLILGFLPIEERDVDAILSLIREKLAGLSSITGLLRVAPGATAYALAVAPSRTLKTGGNFWPALESDLGLSVAAPSRSEFASHFRTVCRQLGLLDGTIEDAGWKHAAPFIFQSGILHYWKDALASGLKSTLRKFPAPDLEDLRALANFAHRLSEHVHNQPILKMILHEKTGPLLVQRLVAAYSRQDWTVLPAHLIEPMRAAFSTFHRGLILPSPFLRYDSAFHQLEIVLPSVPHRLATAESSWRCEGRRYAARNEKTIPVNELIEQTASIELCDLEGAYEKQRFEIDYRFGDEVPFRIFRADTGREHRFRLESKIEMNPGAYVVVMNAEARTNDEEFVVNRDGFRELAIELRQSDDPLVISCSDSTWSLEPRLCRGIYVDHEQADIAILEVEGHLHYGNDLGLVVSFPATEVTEAPLEVVMECEAQQLSERANVGGYETQGSMCIYQESIQTVLVQGLSKLPPGIHRIDLKFSHPTGRIIHQLWYWQGLVSIRGSFGFECLQAPQNLNLGLCQGLVVSDQSLKFRDNYHRPMVTLALDNPSTKLVMGREGIRVVLTEHGADWEDEVSLFKPIVVDRNDQRILKFQSGGFGKWTIESNARQLIELNRRRTMHVMSLAGLADEVGGAAQIFATSEEGRRVPLISINRPMVAWAPKHQLDHQENCDVWKFGISVEPGCEIGVAITDMSLKPMPDRGTIASIARNTDEAMLFDETRWEAATIVVTAYADDVGNVERDIVGTARVRVKSTFSIAALESGLFAVDFFHRKQGNEEWVPLECVEKHGYSRLRFYAWGDGLPSETADWWPRLRRAKRAYDGEATEETLANSLERMSLGQLNEGLSACRELLNWKYPSLVWKINAHRLQELPVYLGRHRFNSFDESASIWWRHGVEELSDYAETSAIPVTRQFLMASQPACLRIPSEQLSLEDGFQNETPLTRSMSFSLLLQRDQDPSKYIITSCDPQAGSMNGEILFCFNNFQAVGMGRESKLHEFSLNSFLKGAVGVKGLNQLTLDLYDSTPRFKVQRLLSPEHLLRCVERLNRRCRPIDQASQQDEEQSLTRLAQTIERMSHDLEREAPNVVGILNWKHIDEFWWIPPLLENQCAVKVAGLLWMVAALARMTAHHHLSPEEYDNRLYNLLCSNEHSEHTLQNRLCILMSLGPELLAFYMALFELTLSFKRNP